MKKGLFLFVLLLASVAVVYCQDGEIEGFYYSAVKSLDGETVYVTMENGAFNAFTVWAWNEDSVMPSLGNGFATSKEDPITVEVSTNNDKAIAYIKILSHGMLGGPEGNFQCDPFPQINTNDAPTGTFLNDPCCYNGTADYINALGDYPEPYPQGINSMEGTCFSVTEKFPVTVYKNDTDEDDDLENDDPTRREDEDEDDDEYLKAFEMACGGIPCSVAFNEDGTKAKVTVTPEGDSHGYTFWAFNEDLQDAVLGNGFTSAKSGQKVTVIVSRDDAEVIGKIIALDHGLLGGNVDNYEMVRDFPFPSDPSGNTEFCDPTPQISTTLMNDPCCQSLGDEQACAEQEPLVCYPSTVSLELVEDEDEDTRLTDEEDAEDLICSALAFCRCELEDGLLRIASNPSVNANVVEALRDLGFDVRAVNGTDVGDDDSDFAPTLSSWYF